MENNKDYSRLKFNVPEEFATTTIAIQQQSSHATQAKIEVSENELNSNNLKERELVKLLEKQLRYKFKNIFIHKNPVQSTTAKRYLDENLGFIPSLQPEIDMIFVENTGMVNAIEVKLIKLKDIGQRARYYKGLEQSIALLRYGFDHVGLWNIFTSDIPIDKINEYGAQTCDFLRDKLKIPLDFTYFRLIQEKKDFKFQILQPTSNNTGFILSKLLDDPQFKIEWRYGNPLLNTPIVKTLRASLNSYIKFEQ